MKATLALFLFGALALWGVASGLAYLFDPAQGELVLAYSGVAALLCVVPCTLTLAWVLWGLRQAPELQRLAILSGSAFRMFVVLGVALVLTTFRPYVQQGSFWLWILVFYLGTLALEIFVVVRRQPLSGDQQK